MIIDLLTKYTVLRFETPQITSDKPKKKKRIIEEKLIFTRLSHDICDNYTYY